MYRVLKDAGNNSNIFIENTETSATVNIGKLSMNILSILSKAGFEINTEKEDSIKVKDRWELNITTETKELLAKEAMRMKKPEKVQTEQVKDLFQKPNKEIDAMDVLLGLASYN